MMRRLYHHSTQIKPPAANFPEKLKVVRAASVYPSGVRLHSSAFVTDGAACWRPGMSFDEVRPVNALGALRRNAEEAARHGVFAEGREGKRAA